MTMRKKNKSIILLLLFFVFSLTIVRAESTDVRLKGRILLQVEKLGEAWYMEPDKGTRVSLGTPDEAFVVMREFGIGITNNDLEKIQVADTNFSGIDSDGDGISDMMEDSLGTNKNSSDTDDDGFTDKSEILSGYDPKGIGVLNLDNEFAIQNHGKIFLQVENNGEAWYVNPVDTKRYFLGRAQDAFNIMRALGLGITNEDLNQISIYGEEVKKENNKIVAHDVPFTPQAPFGEWSDLRQQDGCEEASVIMAMHWVKGEELSYENAREEIIAMSNYELEKYGSYKDTSAHDTVERLFKDYYAYDKVEFKEYISVDDILNALYAEKLVIVPVNGRKLGNPYFTLPGPLIHMLLIKGYDPETEEFITNEPGTRHGESYRYDKEILYNAIRNYNTGNHLEVVTEDKVIIVIEK